MKRRGNREGSIVERKDGRWQGVIDLGWEGGRRRRKYIYARTRAEVAVKLTALLDTRNRGLPLPAGSLTLERYLPRWLEHVKPSVRPKTHEFFAATVRLHILPQIGKVRLEALTPDRVQSLLNRKLKHLSAQSVRHIRTVLKLALNLALNWNLTARNVAALTRGPKVERAPINPLTAVETARLLSAINDHRLAALYVLVFNLGLRRGEALGLRWCDVDFNNSILNVRQSLQRVAGKRQLLPLKTKLSQRTLKLTERATATLRRHRIRQKEEQLAAGADWQGNSDNLIFTSLLGGPLEPNNIGRQFKMMLKHAGIGPHRFSDNRHTAATLLFDNGAHPKQVQELLGHSRVATTLDVYTHQTPATRDDTAARMDAILAAAAKPW